MSTSLLHLFCINGVGAINFCLLLSNLLSLALSLNCFLINIISI